MISPVTILLLDDEPLLRGATAMLLARRGGQVTTAATADEAVALARSRVFDVAVFDVSPPRPAASEVLRRMRAEGVSPRRVIAVSNAPIERREAAQMTAVLPKPYPFDHLLHAVFGSGGRRRTRSGVFERVDPPPASSTRPRATASAESRSSVTPRAAGVRGARGAPRALPRRGG